MFSALPWSESQEPHAETRYSAVARAPTSAWHSFLELLASTLAGSGMQLPHAGSSLLKEISVDGGSVMLAVDEEQRFAIASRNSRNTGVFVGLELFWCPLTDDEAVCGYRLRASSTEEPVAEHMAASWAEFLSLSKGVPESASWQALPTYSQLLATWAANGRVELDLEALTDAKANVALLSEDLQIQTQISDGLREEISNLRRTLHETRSKAKDRHYSWERPDAEGIGDSLQAEATSWEDLSALEAWSTLNEHRIVVMPRALNGAKKSDYSSPDQVRQALEFLAGPYRECRLGKIPKDEMQTALDESGLKMAGSAGLAIAGSEGDAYFIQWNGRRRFLDWHIGRGGGRETRYCLRIYFTWCEVSERAIVGWLPTHLNNSLT